MKPNFKKDDIVKELSNKKGFSDSFSKKLINDLIDSMIICIKSGELNLKNFGTFKLINKSQRIGRNPKTKEAFIISARKSIKFSISKKFNNKLIILNGKIN